MIDFADPLLRLRAAFQVRVSDPLSLKFVLGRREFDALSKELSGLLPGSPAYVFGFTFERAPKTLEDEAVDQLVNTPVEIGLVNIQGRLSRADATAIIDRLKSTGFDIVRAKGTS